MISKEYNLKLNDKIPLAMIDSMSKECEDDIRQDDRIALIDNDERVLLEKISDYLYKIIVIETYGGSENEKKL